MVKRRGSVDSTIWERRMSALGDAKQARLMGDGCRERDEYRRRSLSKTHRRRSSSRPRSISGHVGVVAVGGGGGGGGGGDDDYGMAEPQPPIPGVGAGLMNSYLLTSQSSFSDWKERLYDELRMLKCLFTVEPNVRRKEDMSPEDELKYRSLAKAVILTRVDDQHLRLVQNVDDPLEVMKLLNDHRNPHSRRQQLQAEDRIASLVYEGTRQPMKQFLLTFEQLMNEVERQSGERVSDAQKKEYLLEATISEFPDILDSARMPADKVTYVGLKALLVAEAKKGYSKELREQVKEDMRIQKMIDQNPKLAGKETTCTKCGAYGHNSAGCQRLDRCRKCYHCLSFVDDHVASTCPIRQNYHVPKITKDGTLVAGNSRSTKSEYHVPLQRPSSPHFRPHSPTIKPLLSLPVSLSNFLDVELDVFDLPDAPDSPPPFGGLRKMLHIRRKRLARKLKTGRVPKSDLIFTDSDFYMDVKYTEMFIEENERRSDDIVLETIQVMKTD